MNQAWPGTRALRTFEAAGRHLNFTRAAEELGLTAAAVSYQIKEFEDRLGVTLFTRTSRRMRLTPAGAVLHEAAAEALALLHSAAGRARRIARGSSHLRISMGARFATSWLLPRLPGFRMAHPAIDLAFDITDEVRDFGIDDIDVAIRFGAGRYEGLLSDRLFDTVIVAVASPALVERDPDLTEPRDLLHHTLCHARRTAEGIAWPTWRQWMAAAGINGFDDSRCIAFSDTSDVVQAVIDGNGIGLADLAMIETDLARGRLVRLFDIGLPVADRYTYHLVYPAGSGQHPRILAFRTWLLGQMPGAADGRDRHQSETLLC